jgi:hypothetical protein
MKRLFLIAGTGLVAVLATVGAVIAPATAGDGPLSPALQEVRAAMARYHSFEQAQRDGYTVEGEPCVAAPGLGTMGIHAVNPPLMADSAIDALRPEILLYVPKSNGQLELVGVEYFRRAADQTPPIDPSDKPSLFGVPFDGPMEEHAPGMGWHYDLHVWVAEANPSGVFAPFNPAISC